MNGGIISFFLLSVPCRLCCPTVRLMIKYGCAGVMGDGVIGFLVGTFLGSEGLGSLMIIFVMYEV